jgi:hypothetical protein
VGGKILKFGKKDLLKIITIKRNYYFISIILVEWLFIGMAFHRSGFSSKRLFIKAAFHQSGFSSKRLFIKRLFHPMHNFI